jgi:hypothetical protein
MAEIRTATSSPAKPPRYIVLSETRGTLETEMNKLAEKSYEPVLMSSSGSTIMVIMERE